MTRLDIESYIGDDTTLERGRTEFRLGRVLQLTETEPERLLATVYGQPRNQYLVEVWSEGAQFYSTCTCADRRAVCKHVAAVLHAWLAKRKQAITSEEKRLTTEADYLALFDSYLSENRPEEAMVIGERGIKLLGASAATLAERLRKLYLEWGEVKKAKAIPTTK